MFGQPPGETRGARASHDRASASGGLRRVHPAAFLRVRCDGAHANSQRLLTIWLGTEESNPHVQFQKPTQSVYRRTLSSMADSKHSGSVYGRLPKSPGVRGRCYLRCYLIHAQWLHFGPSGAPGGHRRFATQRLAPARARFSFSACASSPTADLHAGLDEAEIVPPGGGPGEMPRAAPAPSASFLLHARGLPPRGASR